MTDNETPAETLVFEPARLAQWCIITAALLALLVVGRTLLIPLVIAVLLWILLLAIRNMLMARLPGSIRMPRWLATATAIVLVIIAHYVMYLIISSEADAVSAAIPTYERNFAALADGFARWAGIRELPTIDSLLGQLDLRSLLRWAGDSVGVLLSNVALIAIYIGFLLAGEDKLPQKIAHLQRDPARAERLSKLAVEISDSVQLYVGIKTAVSLLTGVVSFVVLAVIGVDFAAVWALLIFLLNFIPNIGSALGVALPALLTLVQFDTLTPFLIVSVGLGTTQFVIGNVIEPAFMGKSLNMSSFMIILALSFWGTVWGVPGMFLSVPLLMVIGIVCAQVTGLRWVAVMLSADGRLMTSSAPSEPEPG